MENNRWLNWKLKHGLAYRGRAAPLQPKGVIARTLHLCWFRFREVKHPEQSGAVKFTQNVGGSLGPTGTTNGE